MEISGAVLKNVQKHELRILKEVDRICHEHNLQYFIDAGTLLGAVRHGGFIPWDDDIDVCMLRKDFELFKIIFPKYTTDEFFLHSKETDEQYTQNFIKVRLKNTRYGSEADQKLKCCGVWIDIFCIDEFSANKEQSARHYKFIMERERALLANKAIPYSERNLKWKVLTLMFSRHFIRAIDSIANQYYLRKIAPHSNDVILLANFYDIYSFNRVCINKKIVFPLKESSFCDIKTFIPNDSEVYLTNMYGDWKKFPPEEERVSNHDITVIEL